MHDAQGNPMSGASRAAALAFDEAVRCVNVYRGDPIGVLDRVVADAPRCVVAHALKAWLLALATEPEASMQARAILAEVRGLPMDEREASQLASLEALLDGRWDDAAVLLDHHSMRWPRDLVALQAGHLLDFYRANARDLRDRIARALPMWTPGMPGHSTVMGMLAFGLEETGDYGRAEAVGRAALAADPLDCWAHHAVAHVMEMQGRAEDGIGWMTAREPHWSGDDSFFKVHNWWHKALCHLDLGQIEEVWRLYDGPIRGQRSSVALDLVDASALLWRIGLAGHEVGDRWLELAAAWDRHADGRLYPFNDWHAVMAYLGAGRGADVERIRAALMASAATGGQVGDWAAATGLKLVDGFAAFARGDLAAAAHTLHAARFVANRFGGSHAQRDVIDWTLTEAALRGGLRDMAEALAHERLAVKPHSPVNRGFLARARALPSAEVLRHAA